MKIKLFIIVFIGLLIIALLKSQILEHGQKQSFAQAQPALIGVPAIAVTKPVVPESPLTTAFSLSDAQAYINNNLTPLGPTTNGQAPSIENMSFTTSKAASDLLDGEEIGVPDNVEVMVVKEKGPFQFSNIPVPQGVTPPIFNYYYRVFDATTGNILLEVGSED